MEEKWGDGGACAEGDLEMLPKSLALSGLCVSRAGCTDVPGPHEMPQYPSVLHGLATLFEMLPCSFRSESTVLVSRGSYEKVSQTGQLGRRKRMVSVLETRSPK